MLKHCNLTLLQRNIQRCRFKLQLFFPTVDSPTCMKPSYFTWMSIDSRTKHIEITRECVKISWIYGYFSVCRTCDYLIQTSLTFPEFFLVFFVRLILHVIRTLILYSFAKFQTNSGVWGPIFYTLKLIDYVDTNRHLALSRRNWKCTHFIPNCSQVTSD